jgi:hypothetical protein
MSRRHFASLRLLVLLLLLAGCLGARLYLLILERSYREPPNYSLIEDGLYMGGYVPEPPPGTTAVLNLCETEDQYRAPASLWEPIPDAEPAPDLDWLRRMVAFVDTQRRGGATVYVHCWAGASRSGMVVTAYEMSCKHWTRDQALEFVRSKRPVTRPNPAFMRRLDEWEQALREQPAPGKAGGD